MTIERFTKDFLLNLVDKGFIKESCTVIVPMKLFNKDELLKENKLNLPYTKFPIKVTEDITCQVISSNTFDKIFIVPSDGNNAHEIKIKLQEDE